MGERGGGGGGQSDLLYNIIVTCDKIKNRETKTDFTREVPRFVKEEIVAGIKTFGLCVKRKNSALPGSTPGS